MEDERGGRRRKRKRMRRRRRKRKRGIEGGGKKKVRKKREEVGKRGDVDPKGLWIAAFYFLFSVIFHLMFLFSVFSCGHAILIKMLCPSVRRSRCYP